MASEFAEQLNEVADYGLDLMIEQLTEAFSTEEGLKDFMKLQVSANNLISYAAKAEEIINQAETDFQTHYNKLTAFLESKGLYDRSGVTSSLSRHQAYMEANKRSEYSEQMKQFKVESAAIKNRLAQGDYSLEEYEKKITSFKAQILKQINQETQVVFSYFGKSRSSGNVKVKLLQALETNAKSYLDMASNHTYIMRFNYSNFRKNAAAVLDAGEKAMELSFNLENLTNAYAEVVARFQKYGIILWKNKSTWCILKGAQMGDLAEVYTTFILRNSSNPSFEGSLEDNVNAFMSGMSKVTNESGALLGDTFAKAADGHIIQYAIKAQGASAMSRQQIVKMAEVISTATSPSQAFQAIKSQLESYRSENRYKVQEGVEEDPKYAAMIQEIESLSGKVFQYNISYG